MKRHNQGFTLIEVMVAVGVIAIALPALMMAMMQQVDGTAYLRDKLQAEWVAENILEEMRIENYLKGGVPPEGKTGTEEMGDRKWYWKSRSKAFKDPLMNSLWGIEVSVWAKKEDADSDPLIKLIGIVRKNDTSLQQTLITSPPAPNLMP